MGLSLKKMFSGSGWKKFKKVVGGVVGTALSVVPGVGGLAGKGISTLLKAKGTVGSVARLTNNTIKTVAAVKKAGKRMGFIGIGSDMAVLKASGPMVAPSAMPGGTSSTATRKRKKRKPVAKKRRATVRRKPAKKKRKSRLKFGSPAYRKKYLGHR